MGMEFFGYLILLALALFAVSALRQSFKRELFCTSCGHVGRGTSHTKGNLGIEIVLWLLFIIPGLIYSVWRHTTRGDVCEKCGGTSLIPPDSPIAQKLRKDMSDSAEPAPGLKARY